jgi:hypothetical protein
MYNIIYREHIVKPVLTVHIQNDDFRLCMRKICVRSLADESSIQMLASNVGEGQMVCGDVIRLVRVRVVYDSAFQEPRDPWSRSA